MAIMFSPALARSRDYPPPRFSMTPQESGTQQFGDRPMMEHVNGIINLSMARNALALIAQSQLSPGSTVLLPAYHCPSLVEPFIWAGCQITFYPLKPDLTPDLGGVTAVAGQPAACVLVRYFGTDCTIKKTAEQLRAAGYLVIEDLAHAAHASQLYGDYGVTSLRKFYPVTTGAEILIGSSVAEPSSLRAAATRWLDTPLRWKLNKVRGKLAARIGKRSPGRFLHIDEQRLGQPMDRTDIREISRHNHDRLAQKRRDNYFILAQALEHVAIGTPLYKQLYQGEVPYVFPFLLKDSCSFRSLREAGIPLFRWEELAATSCKVSKHYRSHLIQFPCHQDLGSADLEYIVNICKSISQNC